MTIISIHEYDLRPEVNPDEFERAWQAGTAELKLPGLDQSRLAKGVKGARPGRYAALWTYASRRAWERLWGPPAFPTPRDDYPESWLAFEASLAPYLTTDPDSVRFTAYEIAS